MRSSRAALLVALFVLPACDLPGCDDEPPAPTGELDRLGDAVLVTPPGYAEEQSFIVLTNPEIQQLRVFDVLEQEFVAASNVYFPLSARTGPVTRRLAAAPRDHRFVYALDGGLDVLQKVSLEPFSGDATAPAFTTVDVIPTERAPGDVAVWAGEDVTHAYVALPGMAAVQRINVDDPDDTELISLGEGAAPARLEVDPTGDALVVTDAVLDVVHVVPLDRSLAVRDIDVGGPQADVSVGMVDPGDGIGPMALVTLRETDELAAIRLHREGFREDRYALHGKVELPSAAMATYVPDQTRALLRACCPLLRLDQTSPEAPTSSWAAVTTADGWLFYVRFDAELDDGVRGLKLIDFGTPRPGPTSELTSDDIWFPGEGPGARPTLTVDAIESFGDPPAVPFFDAGYEIHLTFEGSPPGLANRRAAISADDGVATLEPLSGSIAEVELGDEIFVSSSEQGGSCPAGVTLEVVDVSAGAGVIVAELSPDDTLADLACITGAERRFTLFAAGDFVVTTTEFGYHGRIGIVPPDNVIEVPGFRVGVARGSSDPPRGSQFRVGVTQGLDPVRIHLARQPDQSAKGFGIDALLPQAFVGGTVSMRVATDEPPARFTRMYIATGNGILLDMDEAVVNIDAVRAFQ